MREVTPDPTTLATLKAVTERTMLVTDKGRYLGHFVPLSMWRSAFTDEQVHRAAEQIRPGRLLADILGGRPADALPSDMPCRPRVTLNVYGPPADELRAYTAGIVVRERENDSVVGYVEPPPDEWWPFTEEEVREALAEPDDEGRTWEEIKAEWKRRTCPTG